MVKAGRFYDATIAFEKALESVEDVKAPSEAQVRYEYGLAYQGGGSMDKAIAQFKLAAKEVPEAAEALKTAQVSA